LCGFRQVICPGEFGSAIVDLLRDSGNSVRDRADCQLFSQVCAPDTRTDNGDTNWFDVLIFKFDYFFHVTIF
jgi:hypothetical protein